MLAIKLNHVLFIVFFHVCNCQRRIKDGEIVTSDKRYVVYLLKASVSPQYYDAWLCGGALVSTEFIVTSAACVTDVKHLYAIAGYNKYVSDEDINTDPCTREKKKKIIFTCTPKAYELKYEELEIWSFIDIAIAKVESPYDLTDTSYTTFCSYIPDVIEINYDMKYQEPGTDSLVYGWGHHQMWRQEEDTTNYNQVMLNYAPTLLQDKEECKRHYEVYKGMADVIDKYMICTFDKGNINSAGETILKKSAPNTQGCNTQIQKFKGYEGISCESLNDGEEIILIEDTRRNGGSSNKTSNSTKPHNNLLNYDFYKNVEDSNNTNNYSLFEKLYRNVKSNQRLPTRRHGICQNDHGGPIVTWVGSHEYLIGVASVFKITEGFECTGPYLYTSTQCNGAFLDCILRSDVNKTDQMRRSICESPPSQKGFKLIEKHISWKDHPAGPADNERNTTVQKNTKNLKTAHAARTVNTSNTVNATKLSVNATKTVNHTRTVNATKNVIMNKLVNAAKTANATETAANATKTAVNTTKTNNATRTINNTKLVNAIKTVNATKTANVTKTAVNATKPFNATKPVNATKPANATKIPTLDPNVTGMK